MSGRAASGYLPIADYGLIGDCRSAALVGSDGGIDWLCLPRFDDASIFGRILDAKNGGSWHMHPTRRGTSTQGYRDRSNLLRTVHSTPDGVAVVLDFMPMREGDESKHARPHAAPRLVRIVECLSGSVEMESCFDPAPDYGRAPGSVSTADNRLHIDTRGHHFCVVSTVDNTKPRMTFTLRAGEAAAFGLRSSRAGHCPSTPWSLERARTLARETQEFWWRWISRCTYEGPYQEHVWRSALTLKLLTYAPTGAILAAPTTSLPERIGSYHNYDYRFTWLRDAAFTLYSFFQIGYVGEADGFFTWLRSIGLEKAKRDVPNLYTLDGRARAEEHILENLSGYRNSRPVRIGNAAINQLQLDVYGELLDSAWLFSRFGGKITRRLWDDLHPIVELACDRWREPDRSIWEPREGDQHYTYSKLMCWVAIDRGIRLAEQFHLPYDAQRWRRERAAVHRAITTHAWNEELGAFTQTFGGIALDAAVLRMTQTRFLPEHDERMRRTVDVIANGLSDGGILVRRFLRGPHDGGKKSVEGAFLMCSFWLVDGLAHVGRLDEAEALFEKLLAVASPLGLYAEEADAVTGAMLGNYPQAFTHLALVGAAVNIERARMGTLTRRHTRHPRRTTHLVAPAQSPTGPEGKPKRKRA